MLRDLQNKSDIATLVHTFYSRIRKDVYLAPIFEKHIKDWGTHLEHLTDFWENSLFMNGEYKGNPLKVHEKVDAEEGYKINEQHFGIWLNHWVQTIDDLFLGDNASILKLRARKMGTHIHVHLFEVRSKK
ncbi:MAG: hemoglobin [Flavobacteriales bacterium]|jgi:hemoglobin